jgi:hypothetical protein
VLIEADSTVEKTVILAINRRLLQRVKSDLPAEDHADENFLILLRERKVRTRRSKRKLSGFAVFFELAHLLLICKSQIFNTFR